MKIYYSVLRYELITGKFINLGVIYYNLSMNQKNIIFIDTNYMWRKVKKFNNEINYKYLRIILLGIIQEINNIKYFDIREYTKKFYNELRFSDVKTYEADNFNTFAINII